MEPLQKAFARYFLHEFMAKSCSINVLEHCKVSPPVNSTPPATLPLTFFDIPWLFFSPSQILTFYEYPHSISHFISTTLPNLKHSLSLALQHFFPFVGNLVLSQVQLPNKPNIVYNEGDHVSFTVAESNGNFTHFTSNFARDVNEFYPLVPKLATTASVAKESQLVVPLFAVQVTVFPNSGLCIGIAYHHVVGDGRTFNNFIKAWASLCASESSSTTPSTLPSFDRTVIKDAHGLEEIFLQELWKRKSSKEMVLGTETNVVLSNMARATFVVSLVDIERIKKWIVVQCKNKNQPQPIHLSPYVLTCAFVWVCLVKAKIQRDGSENYYHSDEDPIHFGFIAGGMTRLDFRVPNAYFGNCVGFGRSSSNKNELIGENGIIVASNVIGNTIRKLDGEILGGAKKWISDWEVLFGSDAHVIVSGSPKLDLYKTDFGWGRPKKIEDISIDGMRGISLIESRDMYGGMEVGLALPKEQVDAFRSLFIQGLDVFHQ